MELSQPKHKNTMYVLALILFVIGCLVATTMVAIYRPEQDNTALFTQIFGFMTTVTVAMLAFIKSNEGVAITHEAKDIVLEAKAVQVETKIKQEELHGMVDGRMTEMMAIVKELAYGKGIKEGIQQGVKLEIDKAVDLALEKVAGIAEGRITGTAEGMAVGKEQAEQRAKEDAELLRGSGLDPQRNP